MTNIIERQNFTPQQLIQAVEQMGASELEAFTQNVLMLQAQRRAEHLSAAETELLQRIEITPSFSDKRYRELIAKRQAETLTAEEYSELLSMTERMERYSVTRLEALIQLADLRGVPLDKLMRELGVQAQPYA